MQNCLNEIIMKFIDLCDKLFFKQKYKLINITGEMGFVIDISQVHSINLFTL